MTEPELEKFLRELHVQGVKFIIIGGMAAIAQGSAYLTADLDLCYSRDKENLEKLAKSLESFHPVGMCPQTFLSIWTQPPLGPV